MKQLGVWEPYEVKAQTIKTAVESATLLLRIDDIVSGIQKKAQTAPGQSQAPGPQVDDPDQVRSTKPCLSRSPAFESSTLTLRLKCMDCLSCPCV